MFCKANTMYYIFAKRTSMHRRRLASSRNNQAIAALFSESYIFHIIENRRQKIISLDISLNLICLLSSIFILRWSVIFSYILYREKINSNVKLENCCIIAAMRYDYYIHYTMQMTKVYEFSHLPRFYVPFWLSHILIYLTYVLAYFRDIGHKYNK